MRENGWEATWDGVIKEDISEEVIFKWNLKDTKNPAT